MDIDLFKRHLAIHEMHAHHHHAGHPEKDDIESGDQYIARIIALYLGVTVWPTKRREWPQTRRKPSVQHIFVTAQLDSFAIMPGGRGNRSVFCFFNKSRIVRAIPGRNPMPPPQLAGNTPWLDIAHPFKIGLAPAFRDKFCTSLFDRLDSGCGEFFGIHIPLIHQPWFHHHT